MPPCRCAASPLWGDHRCSFSLTRQLCRSFQAQSFAAASSLQLEGAVTGLEPLSRGGPAGPGLPLWAGGWVQIFLKAERQSFRQPSRRAALRWKEQSVVQSPQQWGRGRRPQGHRYGRMGCAAERCLRQMQRGVLGAALQFSQGRCAARRENWLSARGKHSDRVLRTKQGAVFGAALRFLQAPSAVRRKNRLRAPNKT